MVSPHGDHVAAGPQETGDVVGIVRRPLRTRDARCPAADVGAVDVEPVAVADGDLEHGLFRRILQREGSACHQVVMARHRFACGPR